MLLIANGIRAQLAAFADEAHPFEACALLLGRPGEVLRVVRCMNIAEKPRTAFRVDPVEQLHAELEAREAGLDIVGVWHSHPASPAVPSETDRRAAWPGYVYLISGQAEQGGWQLRAYRRGHRVFHCMPLATPRKEEASTP